MTGVLRTPAIVARLPKSTDLMTSLWLRAIIGSIPATWLVFADVSSPSEQRTFRRRRRHIPRHRAAFDRLHQRWSRQYSRGTTARSHNCHPIRHSRGDCATNAYSSTSVHYRPNAEPHPSITPTVTPTLQAYPVPAGSRPHDVAPAVDGGMWYTAQGIGELGWLDPATGDIRRIDLGPGSAPHGVIVGPDGAPWITDGGLNAIVRVDPDDDQVEVFPIPLQYPMRTSTPSPSTVAAACGSPARTASTDG